MEGQCLLYFVKHDKEHFLFLLSSIPKEKTNERDTIMEDSRIMPSESLG
jgi:hypothetical protein